MIMVRPRCLGAWGRAREHVGHTMMQHMRESCSACVCYDDQTLDFIFPCVCVIFFFRFFLGFFSHSLPLLWLAFFSASSPLTHTPPSRPPRARRCVCAHAGVERKGDVAVYSLVYIVIVKYEGNQ